MTRVIDLNCDMGESFGRWNLGDDEAIMPSISSANIACGFHAGDPHVMRKTVELALAHGVAVGAHPGLPDLMGFGRRQMQVTAEEVRDYMRYQIGALREYLRVAGKELQHLKPHGILYHMMDTEVELANVTADVAAESGLMVIALAASRYEAACRKRGARVAAEGCADRAYNANGTLVSRNVAGSVITNPEQAAEQAVRMAMEGKVRASDGTEFSISVQSIACHGDTPNAQNVVTAVRAALEAAGCMVKPLREWLP